VKKAKAEAEMGKVAIRNIRKEANEKIRLFGISLSNFGEVAVRAKAEKQTSQLRLFTL